MILGIGLRRLVVGLRTSAKLRLKPLEQYYCVSCDVSLSGRFSTLLMPEWLQNISGLLTPTTVVHDRDEGKHRPKGKHRKKLPYSARTHGYLAGSDLRHRVSCVPQNSAINGRT